MPFKRIDIKKIIDDRKANDESFEKYYNEVEEEFRRMVKRRKYRNRRRMF